MPHSDVGVARDWLNADIVVGPKPSPRFEPVAFRVLINGEPHTLPGGTSVLDALRSVGIDVPTLCHDDRLVPSGACRSCLVTISGSPRPGPACTTALADGMEV